MDYSNLIFSNNGNNSIHIKTSQYIKIIYKQLYIK
nr:MAG TPA: hypothetical protein [Caudoviricetes sp.]